MIGVEVSVPIACFRKGAAREFLESEALPPPSTCYGFLLSLVGEEDRRAHRGVRIAPALLSEPEESVVLRTIWRVKKAPLGSAGNSKPDFQVLLSGVELLIWLDSSEEEAAPGLEERVTRALADPAGIERFGGLSLGESTHMVDAVSLWSGRSAEARTFQLAERGRLALPVWVDHVGSKETVLVRGELVSGEASTPELERMAKIEAPPEPKRGKKRKGSS